MTSIYPLELKQHDQRTLHIKWNDQTFRKYATFDLRFNCSCAHCKEEFTGKRILDPKTIPADIYPKNILPVGRYALQMVWSDGHDTGIYTFENLYKLGCEIEGKDF